MCKESLSQRSHFRLFSSRSEHRSSTFSLAAIQKKVGLSEREGSQTAVRQTDRQTDQLSVCPPIFCCLSRFGLQGQQSKQRQPDPCQLLQFIWGDTEAFPSQQRDTRDIFSACSRSAQGILLVGHARNASSSHPAAMG